MPTPQRISLIEAYDNRDVVAWLVRHSTEIEELKTAVEALPDSNEFVLTIGDQTIAGTKSFVNKIIAAGGIEADTLVKINADLQVFGDIYQNGSAYDTHAEQLYTTKDYILMRDGAATGLAPGDMSGLEVIKYDGVNNLRLAADAAGTARIGDVGDEQPLLTRAEAPDLVDGDPLCWDMSENKAVSFSIAAGQNITITPQTHGIEISASGGGGEWTQRADNSDWSDLFDVSGVTITAKKNILVKFGLYHVTNIIPKGMIFQNEVDLVKLANVSKNDTSILNYFNYASMSTSQLTSTQITIKYTTITFGYSGGTITLTEWVNNNYNQNKTDLTIYTMD